MHLVGVSHGWVINTYCHINPELSRGVSWVMGFGSGEGVKD
jgi:hypothetical protein